MLNEASQVLKGASRVLKGASWMLTGASRMLKEVSGREGGPAVETSQPRHDNEPAQAQNYEA